MNGLPRWVVLPAALGALLVVLPVASLLTRVDVGSLWPLLTSPGARDALWLSLRTSVVATLLCVVLGVPLALLLARASFPGRRVVRALLLLPLVLPPVVGGLALLTLLGRSGLLGGALDALGMRVPFTTAAVVLAQAFVALPFLVLTLDGALRSHDTAHEDVAATLGARPTRVLLRVTLPALAPALVSGTVLAFARALGEFGATITFAGALQGITQTLPLEIYLQRSSDPDAAVALSLVLVVVALVIIVAAYGPWFQAGEGGGPGDGSGGVRSASARSGVRSSDGRPGVRPTGGRPAEDGSAARRSVTEAPTGATLPHEPGGRPGGRTGARPPAALSLRVRVPERGVDVALDVPAGEVVAVLGPNGAGKSTLLQAVAGLGDLGGDVSVTLGDRVVAEPGTRTTPPRDRRVGWLGQRALLLRHASVGDNVAFGPVSRGMRRGEARALAHTLLSDVGAAHLAARRPHELSGGQAQRIAIARALATDPDVLLVDEPFSALDVGAAQHARLLLQAAHRSAPRTTLLVTHDLLDVAQLADRVVVIEDGRVVEDGPAAEVLTRPRSTFGGRFAGVNLLVGRVVAPATGEDQAPAAGPAEGSGAVLATPLGEVHGTAEDVLEADAEAVALFEPRAVSVHRDPPGGSPRNAFSVLLTGIEPHGSLLRLWADAGQDHRAVAGDAAWSAQDTGTDNRGVSVRVAADLTPAAVAELSLVPGERLWFVVKAAEVTVLPR